MSQTPAPEGWDAYVRELGFRLHRARIAAGLSQEALAHAAGIATFTYRKLEHGEVKVGTPTNPHLATVMSLAHQLGLTLVEILPPEMPNEVDTCRV